MKKYVSIMIMILALFLSSCGSDTSNNNSSGVDQATLDMGQAVFQANCSACHSATSDAVLVGPPLQNIDEWGGEVVAGLDAYEYTRQSILEPSAHITQGYQDLMPKTYDSTLSDEQVEAVIQYLLHHN